MSVEPSSELERIYRDLSEDGRLDQPPSSPAGWLRWNAGLDDPEPFAWAWQPRVAYDERGEDDPIEMGGPQRLRSVYEELGEGSVRIPGTQRDSEPPDEDDESWLSMEQLLEG